VIGAGLTLMVPIGLVALVSLAAIIVIHMRRKTPPMIVLPSLRFWEPAIADSADRRRFRKPPITLPLLLQLLAALAIGLALARPAMDALPGMAGQRSTPQHSIVLLDGSTSMLSLAGDDDSVTKWDLARDEADDILREWQAGDVITIIVIGSRTQSTSASTEPQIDRLRERIRSTTAPGGIADIDTALELGGDLILPDRANRIILISDGALRANPETASAVEAPIDLRVVGSPENSLPNVAITSIGSQPVANQDGASRLSFALSSFAPETVRLPYRVQADGVDILASELDLLAGETRSVQVTLPQVTQTTEVIVDVGDSFMADNRATLLLEGSGSTGLEILLISDNPGPLERALGALPESRVDVFPTTTPGLRALAAGFDLVVFEGISPPPDDLPNTSMLFVRPIQVGDRFATEGVMGAPAIDRIDAGAPILEGVDLAGVTFGDTPVYRIEASDEVLVRGAANGLTGPLLWRGEIDGLRYVAFGFDLESSNITQRVAFPVLIARTVADLTVAPIPSTLALGDPLLYRISESVAEVAVTNPMGEITILTVPQAVDTVVFDSTGLDGLYTVDELGDDGQVLQASTFVVNAGHPVESDTRPNPSLGDALAGGSASDVAVTERQGLADLWPMLVSIAMAVIALEWLVFSAGVARLPTARSLASAFQRIGGRA